MSRLRMPAWTTVASVVTGLLLAICLYRFVDDVQLYEAAQELKVRKVDELEGLKAKRDDTRELAVRLTSDPLTKERLARAEGYIRPGEIVYLIKPPTKATAPAVESPAPTQ
jgi:cell division protein FtsB